MYVCMYGWKTRKTPAYKRCKLTITYPNAANDAPTTTTTTESESESESFIKCPRLQSEQVVDTTEVETGNMREIASEA